ncbi:hypothetical protein QFC21_003436 [Naganishia friedmannii]|uniref:Uncharacterized protein n=1 Tax=Naganishia friedmannii TaxID=89922 RepID=A0ACC2VQM7_9TREE|nr:hypothetical protein QFC21_003436 [Naganishia friedmannii]
MQDLSLIRQGQQFKRDMEREVERWMDVLMESPCVDRRFLRRASLYLQPHTYDEVTHERHLAELCCYPTCRNKSRKPYTEDAKWKITHNTAYNATLRGPKKRDIVECTGNPLAGFCNKDCAVRSRWYRSRLNVEPVWARPMVNTGDLAAFQKQLKSGRSIDTIPEEVELLEDMEDKGEITIENGELRRCEVPVSSTRNPAAEPRARQESSEASSDVLQTETADGDDTYRPHDEAPTAGLMKKTEIIAESREAPSTLMQRLEQTLSSLRIVENPGNLESSQREKSNAPEVSRHSQLNQHAQSGSRSDRSTTVPRLASKTPELLQSSTAMKAKDHVSTNEADLDEDYDEAKEDDETRMAFNLALAAREQLQDGTF